jgi:very-short-patch-repair endonuclease
MKEKEPHLDTNFHVNRKDLKPLRRQLRNHGTSAEALMWLMIKSRQIEGVKFRRQFSVGPFIIDFYNSETRLGIELDGNPHFTPEGHNHDMQRTEYLKTQHNITILRFENTDVFKCPEGVLTKIKNTIKEIKENQLQQQSDSSTAHT